jgi:hypothetical protein
MAGRGEARSGWARLGEAGMARTPKQGGVMNGGPHNGKIMAFGGPVMPVFDSTGRRLGAYIWDDVNEVWEYEKDDGKSAELYP